MVKWSCIASLFSRAALQLVFETYFLCGCILCAYYLYNLLHVTTTATVHYTTQAGEQRPGMEDMSLCAGYSANVYVSPAG